MINYLLIFYRGVVEVALCGTDCAPKFVEYVVGVVPVGIRTCTVRSICLPAVEDTVSPVSMSQSLYLLSVSVIALLSAVAFEDCGEKMRMLDAAGIELEPLIDMKSENFMRNAFSVVGTVKCNVHSQPLANVLSAVAFAFTAVTLLSASGVDVGGVAVEVEAEVDMNVRMFDV